MRWVVVLIIAASICWVAPAWVALLFVGGYLLAHRIETLQDRVDELERERSTEGHWEDEAELRLSTSIVQALSERREVRPVETAPPEPEPDSDPDPDPNSVEGVLRQIEREEEQGQCHVPPTAGNASTWAVIVWIALVAVGAWLLL